MRDDRKDRTTDSGKLLEVKNLNIEFYDTVPPQKVVKGVSFSMDRGEILGIVGESGSGKTQTALSILRLLKSNSGISGGQILFKGRDLALYTEPELEAVRGGEIAMIFQEPMTSLNPVLTVGSQIEEGLKLHTRLAPEERKRRVILAMEEAGLPGGEELYRKYPHQLSGGMRQRVMIAAALVTEPELLIGGRTDYGPGCDRPGPGPGAAEGDQPEARHGHPLYFP